MRYLAFARLFGPLLYSRFLYKHPSALSSSSPCWGSLKEAACHLNEGMRLRLQFYLCVNNVIEYRASLHLATWKRGASELRICLVDETNHFATKPHFVRFFVRLALVFRLRNQKLCYSCWFVPSLIRTASCLTRGRFRTAPSHLYVAMTEKQMPCWSTWGHKMERHVASSCHRECRKGILCPSGERRKTQHGRGVYEFDLDVLNNKLA
jgi:hypothetical protein